MSIIPKFATVEIESVHCGADNCDALVVMPAKVMQAFRDSHKTWYCYRGHPRHFPGESKEERLKQKLENTEKMLRSQIKRTEWAQEAERKAELSRRATKGQLTKTKNRIKNGVCPCCNRTFVDLGRHMAGQHPDYGKDKA